MRIKHIFYLGGCKCYTYLKWASFCWACCFHFRTVTIKVVTHLKIIKIHNKTNKNTEQRKALIRLSVPLCISILNHLNFKVQIHTHVLTCLVSRYWLLTMITFLWNIGAMLKGLLKNTKQFMHDSLKLLFHPNRFRKCIQMQMRCNSLYVYNSKLK